MDYKDMTLAELIDLLEYLSDINIDIYTNDKRVLDQITQLRHVLILWQEKLTINKENSVRC